MGDAGKGWTGTLCIILSIDSNSNENIRLRRGSKQKQQLWRLTSLRSTPGRGGVKGKQAGHQDAGATIPCQRRGN